MVNDVQSQYFTLDFKWVPDQERGRTSLFKVNMNEDWSIHGKKLYCTFWYRLSQRTGENILAYNTSS